MTPDEMLAEMWERGIPLKFEGVGSFRLTTNLTAHADALLTKLLNSIGLERILFGGEDPDIPLGKAFMERGKLFEIAGICLIPEKLHPLNWTPEVGKDTAANLMRVNAHDSAMLLASVVKVAKAHYLRTLNQTRG